MLAHGGSILNLKDLFQTDSQDPGVPLPHSERNWGFSADLLLDGEVFALVGLFKNLSKWSFCRNLKKTFLCLK